MTATIIERNINLVAPTIINPKLLDKYFLLKNEILVESQILPDSQFNEFLNNINSQKFNIIIHLGRIIIVSKHPETTEDKINEILAKIVNSAKISNSVLGFNFDWKIFLGDGETAEKISKVLFYNDKNPVLAKYFNSDDDAFGFYASKNFKKSRLKLDVKPVNTQKLGQPGSRPALQFRFNFQITLNNINNTSEIIQTLQEFDEYFNESKNIISIYE
jgi:hypothetical protein